MLSLKVRGTVREAETEIDLPGLVVKVYDPELRFDDFLGTTSLPYTFNERMRI